MPLNSVGGTAQPAQIDLPAPRVRFDLTMHDGAVIRIRVHGNLSGPRLFLSHGNGFAADAYYPFWRLLAHRYEIVLHDARNHGHNPFHSAEGHCWTNFEQDVETVRRGVAGKLGEKLTVGVYHSLSAIAAVRHACRYGWVWDALVLFEPPLLPPVGHSLREEVESFEEKLANWAAGRPERFTDPEVLAERWRCTRSTSRWLPEAYGLMARSILRHDTVRGDWRLACPPDCESRVYSANIAFNEWTLVEALPAKGTLIAGSEADAIDAQPPAKCARAISELYNFPYAAVPSTSHLLQIEEPETCAAITDTFLAHALADGGRP